MANNSGWSIARRVGVAIVGGLVVAVGLAMIVLPGPAFVVIPLGLGILSLEFKCARRWLAKARQWGDAAMNKYWRKGARRSAKGLERRTYMKQS